MIRPPPRATLFPCTTLFRSERLAVSVKVGDGVLVRFQHHPRDCVPRDDDPQGAMLQVLVDLRLPVGEDRKSTRLNSSHGYTSYAVFCLKKKSIEILPTPIGD